jgi:hypothetical protein
LSDLLGSLETKHTSGVPDKTSGFDHITEAGGYCVFKKFIQNFTGIIKKNIMAKKNIEIKDLVQERKQTNLMHYQPF